MKINDFFLVEVEDSDRAADFKFRNNMITMDNSHPIYVTNKKRMYKVCVAHEGKPEIIVTTTFEMFPQKIKELFPDLDTTKNYLVTLQKNTSNDYNC